MIEGDCVALYARVSSDGQARDNTIASQIAALQERVAADGFRVLPDHAYVDEGYSGTILLRPALEKMRDAVAAGIVTRIYIHAPDRLVRRYAHQILLIEEFHRVGAEVIFLNHSIGGTAEDDLLLQVQGVIAEYERAKILERGRRGRRHAARSGSVRSEQACAKSAAVWNEWVAGRGRTLLDGMRRRSTACSTIQPISVARSSAGFTTARLVPGRGRSEGILCLRRVPPNASWRLARNGSRSPFRLWSIRRCSRPFARNSTKTASASETGRPAPVGCCRGWPYAVAVATPVAARRFLARGRSLRGNCAIIYAVAPRDIDLAAHLRAAIDRCAPTSSKRLSGAR